MAGLILVRNVVGELRPKRTLAASRGFLAAARLSCCIFNSFRFPLQQVFGLVKIGESLTRLQQNVLRPRRVRRQCPIESCSRHWRLLSSPIWEAV